MFSAIKELVAESAEPFAGAIVPSEVTGTLERLVELDPRTLVAARTLDECQRDHIIASLLGLWLETLRDHPIASQRPGLLERARSWQAGLAQRVDRRRRFIVQAHEMALEAGTTPDRFLDNDLCQYIAEEVSDEQHEKVRRDAEIRRAAFGGDIRAELRAYKDGTHPLRKRALDQAAE